MFGIIAAMPEEIREIERDIAIREHVVVGNRDFHIGTFGGQDIVLVLSRIGKVAAGATAATLIDRFNVSGILLTGVAGAIHQDVEIGDIVIGDSYVQHDMDASATQRFARFEVPLLGITTITGCPKLSARAFAAGRSIVAKRKTPPRLHRGLIGSGDQFIASAQKVDELQRALPGLLCVEMEGAAVAQVCHEFSIPFTSIRTISDKADDSAHIDFLSFIEEIAAPTSHELVHEFLSSGNFGS